MRVLAIRGRNLASLAGDFEVDFAAEPLATAGIFAITGPTGAGKSTLLDAVCLALYGEIPRLRAAPGSGRLGTEDAISLKDPRSILRHGAGEGFAEVDFALPGGASYRATWSVKRARGKADGKLQNAAHAFERTDQPERLGGTRTETLAEIQRVIGLSAEQFGRAVLLAQGDFEAFIRADANERAVLLERLTGSGIYARLGRAAAEKAKALREGLDDIRRSIAAQQGLTDEQRAAAEADCAAAKAAEDEAAAALALLDKALLWERRKAECERALEQARHAVEAAAADCDAAAPRRAQLERDRAAAAIAPAWTAAAEAERDLSALADRIAGEEQALAEARAAEEQALLALNAAETAVAETAARAEALEPHLTRARELDVRIDQACQQLDQAREAVADRRAKADEAASERDTAAAALAEARDRHAGESAWLAANAASEELARRESDLAHDLEEYAAHVERLAQQEQARARHEQGQHHANATLQQATEALQKAEEAHAEAQAALTTAEADLPPESRFSELSGLRDRLAAIETLAVTAGLERKALEQADAALAATLDKIRANAAAQEGETDRKAALEARLPALVEARETARGRLALLTATLGDAAVELRTVLREGDACPVCGSDAHRLDRIDRTLDKQLEPLRANLAEREAKHDAAAEQSREAAAQLAALVRAADQLAREREEQARHLARTGEAAGAAQERLAEAAKAEGLPGDLEALPPALAARRAAVADELTRLTCQREAAQQARTTDTETRNRRDEAATAHQQARDSLSAHSRAQEETERTIAAIRDGRDRLGAELDRWLAPLGDWRTLPDAAPRLSVAAADWRTHALARAKLGSDLPALGEQAASAGSTAHACAKQAEEAEAAAQSAAMAHADLADQRAALLGGEPTAVVAQRLTDTQKAAQATREAATRGRQDAVNHRTSAETKLGGSRTQSAQTAKRKEERDTALAALLARAGFGAEEVARVAALPSGALDEEASALEGLERTLVTARAVEQERRGDLTDHFAKDAPALTGPDLVEAYTAATDTLRQARESRAETDAVLRQDDTVRQATATLRARLESETAKADVWLRLDQAIGDATGARFRRFAQGLTLERLLDHANARLSELKPRYTLERGAGGEMLIQVIDNDMAGEVRGLHNLSGGERFLVSLALALGLAEMSTTGGVRIESLFIDEGFGALDPASLGQAVALLEQLHATGRRVGVISHVEELKERIPTKIEVTPTGRGTSRVEVVAA